MNQKNPYSFSLVVLLAIASIISCNTEHPKTHSSDSEDTASNVSNYRNESNLKPEIIDTRVENLSESKKLSDSLNISKTKSNTVKATSDSSITVSKGDATKRRKPTKKKRQPKLEFEQLVWDFGEIIEGDIVEKKFKFTNTGNAPLEIIATSATCGCTRPSFPFLAIAPGESNVIGVNYNSVGKEGPQNPEVTIESNTKQKTTTIKLQGIVKPRPKEDNKATVGNDSIEKNR